MIKLNGTFDNVSVKNNGTATMKIKIPMSEVASYIKLVTVIGRPIRAIAVVEDEKVKLGEVTFKQLSIDKDGEAKFAFDGYADTMELSKIYSLVDKLVVLKLKDENGETDE